MKNKAYSLQLLTHRQIFTNREEAIIYFEDNFKPFALIGEPAIAFYGDEKSPKAIIALGVSDKKIFFIDTNDLSEKINRLSESSDDEQKEIANSLDLIKNIITACGLTLDENKKTNRVTYDADTKDDVIGDTKTLAEAIDALSKFVQKGFKDNELKVEDTESIKLSYKPDATDGKKLTAEVKLSNNGDSDDTDFNDNIICKKSDGLYAAANLEYDEEKHTLTFTSSGYKDGKYKDDAHKKVINLDEHTIVSTENHHHNIELVVNKIAGTNKYVISGDARLSEDENNILKIEDDHLIVDGRAKNIKYGDITVAKGLNNLKDRCDDLSDKIDNIKDSLFIDGTTTDTFEANVVKGTHGFTVSGDVRLSNDSSVKVSDGGLSVNVDVDVDPSSNQLTLKVGNRIKMVSLPGIQIVKNIRYDEKTASIIIEFKDSNTPLTIPVSDMIETIYVQNDTSSAVELHKHEKEGEPGRSYLSATIKLKTSGNILAKDPTTGELYVPETAVSNAVAVETNRALEAERTITEKVNTVSSSINDEIERAKEAERVLSETDNTIKNEITSVKNNLETEKTARESFDNNIKTIVDGHTQSLTDINSSLDDVKSKITDETSARKLADTTLQSSIDANKTAVDKEVTRAKEAETAIASNVAEHIKVFDTYKENTDLKIADLTQSDNDIKSLIADKVADINNEISSTNTKVTKLEGDTSKLSTDVNAEVTRAKAADVTLQSNIDKEAVRATTKETELKVSVDANSDAITKETERAKVKETELFDIIKDNATKASFVVNKSNTINLTKTTKDDGSSVLTGNVEISTLDGNLLKKDQPLYASVYLTYDAGTNTLKFNSSALETEKVIKLNAGSVIDRMYYDAATEELVILYTNANGEQSEVRFSARTLFNKWDVQKNHLGGIILDKQVNKEGTDILSGAVVLSTLSTNALINDQGSLYVSNQAKDYFLSDGTTVQSAIGNLQKKVDEVGDNTELNDRLTRCESQVNGLVGNDSKQDTKLATLEKDVENLKKKPSLKVANTNSVAMTVNDETITSEIRLASVDNLIHVNEDGLSFDGSIDYGTY